MGLIKVEHLRIVSSSYIINYRRLQINSDVSGNKLPSPSLFVESGEVLVTVLIFESSIFINPMLRTILCPYGISKLDSCLTYIHSQNLASWHSLSKVEINKFK